MCTVRGLKKYFLTQIIFGSRKVKNMSTRSQSSDDGVIYRRENVVKTVDRRLDIIKEFGIRCEKQAVEVKNGISVAIFLGPLK